jgi:ribulose-bisphosphate carboxylase large chain
MKRPVAFPSINENSEAKRNKFKGVRAYALDYYVPEYVPSDTDLLCAFRIEPLQGVGMIEASAAVAAESSTGTWAEVWSNQLADVDYYEAKVYRVAK